MRAARSPFSRIIAVAMIAAFTLSLTGCSLFNKPKPFSVADPGGSFHIKFPGTWVATVNAGTIQFYGSTTPPKTDKLTALAGVVFIRQVSPEEMATAEFKKSSVPALLEKAVKDRATQRKWSSEKIGAPKKTKIGGRTGYVVTVSATDAQGVKFSGAYYYVRTSDREVYIITSAPVAKWPEAQKQVTDIVTNQWFWHVTESQGLSNTTTSTPATKQ